MSIETIAGYCEDNIESYSGKWAILYFLDDGTCCLSDPEHYKDTRQEKQADLDNMQMETRALNDQGMGMLIDMRDGRTYACLFNSTEFKNLAHYNGIRVCTQAFPVPVMGSVN